MKPRAGCGVCYRMERPGLRNTGLRDEIVIHVVKAL